MSKSDGLADTLMKDNLVKSYAFALRIIALVRWLRGQKEYELGSQVLRAGTGIGSNVEEALAPVSRAEFAAKMGIASKEAREPHYWLRLLRDAEIVPSHHFDPLFSECLELVRILTAIVKTSQAGSRKAAAC